MGQVVAISINLHCIDMWKCISHLPIREQDIVLGINSSDWFLDKKYPWKRLDLKPAYEDQGRGNMFCGAPIHTNPEGNRRIAEEIIGKYLKTKIRELSDKESNGYIQKGELLNPKGIKDIEGYISRVPAAGSGKTGAIVMNGNPFTKGHRYLIEYAAKNVEKLYIFVVEEDKSYL